MSPGFLAAAAAALLLVAVEPAPQPGRPPGDPAQPALRRTPRHWVIRDVMTAQEETDCGLRRLTTSERAAFEAWINRYMASLQPSGPRGLRMGIQPPKGGLPGSLGGPREIPPGGPRGPADSSGRPPGPPPGPLPGGGSEVYYRDDEPVLVKKVDAPNPGIAGKVILNVLVGTDGRVQNVEVAQGDPRLNDAAIAAVKQWLFKPAMAGGHPVAVWVAVPLQFR